MDLVIFIVAVLVLGGVHLFNSSKLKAFHEKQEKIKEAIAALEAQLKALKK